MGYAALTIVLWVVVGQPYTPLGYFTKLVQLALIVLLWLDWRQARAVGESSQGPATAT